jgi:hypothetical protein
LSYVLAEPYGCAAILVMGVLAFFWVHFITSIHSLVTVYLLYRIWDLERKVHVLAAARVEQDDDDDDDD